VSMRTKLIEHRPEVRQWIEALRRPGLMQTNGRLMSQVTDDERTRSYCCLGVVEEKRGCRWVHRYAHEHTRYGPSVSFLPLRYGETRDSVLLAGQHAPNCATLRVDTMRWLGLQERDPYVAIRPGIVPHYPDGTARNLSSVNDSLRLPLFVIADVIEAQPFDWDGTYGRAARTLRAWQERV
jgi:hypothetical protein